MGPLGLPALVFPRAVGQRQECIATAWYQREHILKILLGRSCWIGVSVRENRWPEIRQSLFRASFSLILGETWLGRTPARKSRRCGPRLLLMERPSDCSFPPGTQSPPFGVRNVVGKRSGLAAIVRAGTCSTTIQSNLMTLWDGSHCFRVTPVVEMTP
jgi:hypothetical protein